ncbi:FIST signal transduction protein [Vibrio sp. HN007]|uniref:FIST signal transduction protein n=1 Tax=Vibrio iocasae TaxID=3098914 RepID=UPI0035D50982
MQLHSCFSHNRSESEAVAEIAKKLGSDRPAFIVCYYTEEYSVPLLSSALSGTFSESIIQGCSSFQGVVTDEGYHEGPVVAILAFFDNSQLAGFGSALEHFPAKECSQQDISELAQKTLDRAIEQANRIGELPSLVILHSTIGHEEGLVESIESRLGGNVNLIGGSAADNNLENKWSILCDNQYSHSGLSVSVLYSSVQSSTAFSSGHFPTDFQGIATKTSGRTLLEIDGENASDVYSNWVKAHFSKVVEEGDYKKLTAIYPLGRVAGEVFGSPYFKLSHPLDITPDGIPLFTNIDEGDRVHLLAGGKEQLIKRAGMVTQSAINAHPTDISLFGGVNIFCAGSMSIILDKADKVYESMAKAYGNHPFICPFTFGEQGCFINGENAHGNLMVSSAIFYSKANHYE